MSCEEALEFYKELINHYGDSLANFEHHPLCFKYQVNCYKYYKSRQK